MKELKEVVVAVAGNPNCGKSTLINTITKSRLHVGNWSGVTVGINEADIKKDNIFYRFVDLPGVYNLDPYSQDEIIARDFLINQKPDIIINVIDATNLERNLHLTIQLMELNIPIIIALNMYDEAEIKGFTIDVERMEKLLGVKIIPTTAIKRSTTEDLTCFLFKNSFNLDNFFPRELKYNVDIENAILIIKNQLAEVISEKEVKCSLRWLSLKILEEDEIVYEIDKIKEISSKIKDATDHIRKTHSNDIKSLLADERYALASGLTKEVLKVNLRRKYDFTEKIDKYILNKYFGLPIFAVIMWFVFKFTFDLGNPFVDWLDSIINGPILRWSGLFLNFINSPLWLKSLIQDGIIAGVGAVFVFVPIIFFMMFFITFLEGSGYMARAAFLMDRVMHVMGLHGKSFIPLLLGFGCNVPSIYATRTLESKRDRIMTSLLVPLMSCGARLPVYILFTAIFFPGNAGLVLWVIYLLGIFLAFFMGFVFKKTIFKGNTPEFIMELPPYRMPSFLNLIVHTWEKVKHFVIKAGTYILLMSIIVWALFYFPIGAKSKKDSYLGKAGQIISPVFKPLGFGNWKAGSSLITGIVAKEVIVTTMSEIYISDTKEKKEEKITVKEEIADIFYGAGKAFKGAFSNLFSSFFVTGFSSNQGTIDDILGKNKAKKLKSILQNEFNPFSAFSFMVFVLLYFPCIVVIAVIRVEFGTWKWVGITVLYQILLAWIVSFIIYQGGRLILN